MPISTALEAAPMAFEVFSRRWDHEERGRGAAKAGAAAAAAAKMTTVEERILIVSRKKGRCVVKKGRE